MRLSVPRDGVFFLDGYPVETGAKLEMGTLEKRGGPLRWIPVTFEIGAALTPRVILPLPRGRQAIPAGQLELRWRAER